MNSIVSIILGLALILLVLTSGCVSLEEVGFAGGETVEITEPPVGQEPGTPPGTYGPPLGTEGGSGPE